MADIIVDVSLPSPIITDVTSPSQALVTNVSVPQSFYVLDKYNNALLVYLMY
jgi:hypothetical protein